MARLDRFEDWEAGWRQSLDDLRTNLLPSALVLSEEADVCAAQPGAAQPEAVDHDGAARPVVRWPGGADTQQQGREPAEWQRVGAGLQEDLPPGMYMTDPETGDLRDERHGITVMPADSGAVVSAATSATGTPADLETIIRSGLHSGWATTGQDLFAFVYLSHSVRGEDGAPPQAAQPVPAGTVAERHPDAPLGPDDPLPVRHTDAGIAHEGHPEHDQAVAGPLRLRGGSAR
ncbi:hypothetical protein [Streptomyces mirabilis]|uniref:hypothetical protein n=1 Tax=Streptomyces mirabilis TaxID=68239 RepID=UPI0037F890B7